MPAAILRVERLLLRAQDEVVHEALLGLAPCLVEDRLERRGRDLLLVLGQVVAERAEDDPKRREARFVGAVVDTVEGGSRHEDEVPRDGLVRREHELLDEPVRLVADGLHDRDDVALLAEDHVRVRQVEVQRPAPHAARLQRVRRALRDAQHVSDFGGDGRGDRREEKRKKKIS